MKSTVIFLLSLLLAQVVSAYDLDQHLWRERLLILIAPSAEDPGLQQQRRVVAARRDDGVDAPPAERLRSVVATLSSTATCVCWNLPEKPVRATVSHSIPLRWRHCVPDSLSGKMPDC